MISNEIQLTGVLMISVTMHIKGVCKFVLKSLIAWSKAEKVNYTSDVLLLYT